MEVNIVDSIDLITFEELKPGLYKPQAKNEGVSYDGYAWVLEDGTKLYVNPRDNIILSLDGGWKDNLFQRVESRVLTVSF